jgi:hypothetical protein
MDKWIKYFCMLSIELHCEIHYKDACEMKQRNITDPVPNLSDGGADDETATITEEDANGQCCLVCEYRGKRISVEAHDYFDALSNVRLELEKKGLIPFCYGASLNVFPSQMARQMGR